MRTHPNARAFARARTVLGGLVVIGLTSLALAGAGVANAAGAPAQTTFVDEGFTGASTGDSYILPATTASSGNVACLTAVPTSAAPNDGTVPTCVGASDAVGSGALRLTGTVNNQSGGVGAKQSVPITKGIDAVFNSYQYNGTAADGIVFYLAATDPYNPAVPEKIGYLGGSLGYSASTTNNAEGLSHAYLGIGLDRYGNFANRQFGGTGCTTDQGTNGSIYANAVTVRGPGNGQVGYCVQSKTAVNGSLQRTGVTDRSQAVVPVEIVINPTSSTLTAQQNTSVQVPGGSYAVIFTSIGGTQQVVTGTLPNLSVKNDAGIDPSWIDPSTGYPYKLTYGWVAGTGGQNDVHEVNYLRATTVAGPVPVLTADAGGSSHVAHGGAGTYTVTPTVSSAGGSESQKIRTTTTFPAGTTPSAADASGDGWSCTASGQVVTCDQAVDPASPIAAGSTLPTLSIPYTVSGGARTATISSVVASTDAEAVTTSNAVTVDPQGTSVSLAPVTASVGSTATVTATVSSTATDGGTTPTGSVTISTGSDQCVATLVDGVGSCDLPFSSVGTTALTVSYGGDADHVSSTGRGSATVGRAPSTVTIAVSPSAPTAGAPVTLSVTGPDTAGSNPAPTGTVEFRDGSTILCTVTLPDSSCVTTALHAGSHTLTAVYSGDDRYAGAASVAVDVVVAKVATTIGGAPSNGGPGGGSGGGGSGGDPGTTVTVTHGQTVTLATTDVPADATGTIDYVTDDGTVLCTATLPDTTCAIPDDLAGGTYRIHARYSGDADHEPADGTPFDLVVAPQPTSLTGAGTDSTVPVGQKVRLRTSGLPAGATGTVVFRAADGTVLCSADVEADGTASCTTDALPVGKHVVTADYSGDASFAASSATLPIEVVAAAVPSSDPTPTADPTAGSSASPTPGATARHGVLAFTGSPVALGTGLALALAMLLAGAGLVVVRRRGRSTEETEPLD